jgi:hypothetical protein
MKCKDIISSLNDIIDKVPEEEMIKATLNKTYDLLPDRIADCELGLVGKPVFYHAIESEKIGAWLRDPVKVDNNTVEKVWLTKDSDKTHLFEYRNKQDYQRVTKLGGQPTRNNPTTYTLPCAYEVIEI